MKNRKSTVIWVLFICLMLFAACGRQDQEETQEATGEIQTEASVQEPEPEVPREPVDWTRGGYEMPRMLEGELNWKCLDSRRLEIPEPDFDYIQAQVDFDRCDSFGSDFYVLREYELG